MAKKRSTVKNGSRKTEISIRRRSDYKPFDIFWLSLVFFSIPYLTVSNWIIFVLSWSHSFHTSDSILGFFSLSFAPFSIDFCRFDFTLNTICIQNNVFFDSLADLLPRHYHHLFVQSHSFLLEIFMFHFANFHVSLLFLLRLHWRWSMYLNSEF